MWSKLKFCQHKNFEDENKYLGKYENKDFIPSAISEGLHSTYKINYNGGTSSTQKCF